MNLAEVYQRVNGRPATNEDLARITKVANALGVAGQDTFLCLLVAYDHYMGLYNEIPGQISEGVKEVVAKAKALADTEIKRLQASAADEVAKAVQQAATASAAAASTRTVVAWIGGGLVFMALVVGGLVYWLNDRAFQAGYKEGTVELARRDGFQSTEDYRKALKLYESGDLHEIVMCSRKGWNAEKGMCYPQAYKGEDGKEYVQGWKIPK